MIANKLISPTSKFGLNTAKATEFLPVRVIEVNSDAKFGTVAYEEAVRLACLKAKQAEQEAFLKEQNASRQQSE
jgi:hypothetical protein